MHNHIKRARENAGYTLAELSKKSNLKDSILHSWEKGRTLPRIDLAIRVCDILKISLDEYIGYVAKKKELTPYESMAAARKKAGLTIEQLADRCGLAPQTISQWENGHVAARIYSLLIVCDELGISIDDYVGHEVKTED